MLRAIELESFKCFRKLVLPLDRFTLLTGKNASGKSTVLQALLLLQQIMLEVGRQDDELRLNGSLVSLGTAMDVLDKVTGSRECAIALELEAGRVRWTFSGRDRHAMTMPLELVQWFPAEGEPRQLAREDKHGLPVWGLFTAMASLSRDVEAYFPFLEALRSLQYISAERIGPRETYPLIDLTRFHVGAIGENAPALIYRLADDPVAESLVVPTAPPTLRNQVQAWMREFFPGCGIDVQPVSNANLVTLGIRTSDGTDYHRPQHVGFGLTHVLPIITAALVAQPGQILMVENPEVHLHPAGQSWMGQFLVRVAATGVQVIVETHSDHVLNGLRRAVRNQHLAAGDVAVHFFNERPSGDVEQASRVISPTLDQRGNFDHWPDGFFDQFDKDMDFFADWGD